MSIETTSVSFKIIGGALARALQFNGNNNKYCEYRFFSKDLMRKKKSGDSAADAAEKFMSSSAKSSMVSSGGAKSNDERIESEINQMSSAVRNLGAQRYREAMSTGQSNTTLMAMKNRSLMQCAKDIGPRNSIRKFVTGFLSLAAPPRATGSIGSQDLRQMYWNQLMQDILEDAKFKQLSICGDVEKDRGNYSSTTSSSELVRSMDSYITATNLDINQVFNNIVQLSVNAVRSNTRVQMKSDSNVYQKIINHALGLSGRSYECYGPARVQVDQFMMEINQLVLAAAYGSLLQMSLKELEEHFLKSADNDESVIASRLASIINDKKQKLIDERLKKPSTAEVESDLESKKRRVEDDSLLSGIEERIKQIRATQDSASSRDSTAAEFSTIRDEQIKRAKTNELEKFRQKMCKQFPLPFSPYFTTRLLSVLTNLDWKAIASSRSFRSNPCSSNLLSLLKSMSLLKNIEQEIKDRQTLMDYADWIATSMPGFQEAIPASASVSSKAEILRL